MSNIKEGFFIPIEEAILNPLTGVVLWIVFSILFLLWAAMSVILRYHWKSYSFEQKKITRSKQVYFTGSFLFIGIIIFYLIFY